MSQVNLSIKGVPASLAESLRRRADRHHRSLQGELMAIIEQAVAEEPAPNVSEAVAASASPQSVTQGWKTIEQLIAERQAVGRAPDLAMTRLPRGADILRADRDGR